MNSLSLAGTLVPVDKIVWIERGSNTTIVVFTTNTGDGGNGMDIISCTVPDVGATNVQLNAFNTALIAASSANQKPNTVFVVEECSSIAIG
jgi:hypothetical protein